MLHSRPSWMEMPALHKDAYSYHPLTAVSAIQLGHYSQQLNSETQVSSAVPGARRPTKCSSDDLCEARRGWVRTTAPLQALFETQVSDLCVTDLLQQGKCFMTGFISQVAGLWPGALGSFESTTENKMTKTSCTTSWGEERVRIAVINFSF